MLTPRLLSCLCALGLWLAPSFVRAQAAKPKRLTLAELMSRAKLNPLSRSAYQSTLAARAKLAEARGARLGKVSLEAWIAPSPDVRCVTADCTRTSTDQATVEFSGVFSGFRVSVTQPLYTFGKLEAVARAARKAVEAARAQENQLAGRAAVEAATVYYGLKLARELRWMLEDGRDEIKKALAKLEAQLEAGKGDVTIQDKLRLETLLTEVAARLIEARTSETMALAGVRLIARDKRVDIDEESLDAARFQLSKRRASYLEQARRYHPQVHAARAGWEAKRALHSFEKAKWFPNLALVAGFSLAGAQGVDNPPSAFANDPYNGYGASLALVLKWEVEPLQVRARVAHARANARQAQATLEAAELAAELAVTRAHTNAKQAQQKLSVARRGEKAARGWVASVVQAEAIGVISAKDMADAYVAYFTARARVLQSLYDWNLAVMQLRREVGEFTARQTRRTH